MEISAIWWLFFNVISIIFLGFYSMMEMACVSFNKVRLHYYVYRGNKRAQWLNYLLHHPFRLFGTTLIGVNVAMFVGSECAREFHSSLGLNPDLAPLTQVALVVVFAELAPMFAARLYPEYIAMMGAPLVYASAKFLAPALWVIGGISKTLNFLLKGKTAQADFFLSQEELQKILEEKGEPSQTREPQEFNVITQNIFELRHKKAKDVMTPIALVPHLPSNSPILQMKEMIQLTNVDFITIFYKEISNIVGIAFPRDLLRTPDKKRIRDYARAPWFVTEKTPITQILQQFKKNNENVAVILDKKGKAVGLLTLDDLLTEIFGETETTPKKGDKRLFFMERTFPGSMKVGDFNRQFGISLDPNGELTLSQLMSQHLSHHPEEGDGIFIPPIELIAKETSLLEVKAVTVKSRNQ